MINKKLLVFGLMTVIAGFCLGGIIYNQLDDSQVAAAGCSSAPINSPTLIKTNHLRTDTDGYGVLPTKDGGYLLTGNTIWTLKMENPNPFAIKLNSKGELLWNRQYGSDSMPDSGYAINRLAVETTDGNYITANNITDFIDAKYEKLLEVYGDILITKLNAKGTQLWSVMIGDYSTDWIQKMWPASDGGVILLARIMQTGYGNDIADIEAIPKYSVLIKINKNGTVQWTKKLNWEAVDIQYLPDDGFIALANISLPKTEQSENILEVAASDLPTIIKLDKKLNIEWAKSIEMIPSEINSAVVSSSSGLITRKTKIRMMGGNFYSVQFTPDGGFIAFGYANLLANQGMYGSLGSVTLFDPRPLIALKVDAKGKYLWAKKLTDTLSSGLTADTIRVTKTADDNFVIMRDVIRDSANRSALATDASQKQKAVSDKCKELNCKPGEEIILPEVKPLAEAANTAAKLLTNALATNVELIKTDADFNPKWIKKIDIERDLKGYDIKPTTDKGMVISGTIETDKMYKYINSWHPYKEAVLIKADINGKVNGFAKVTDHSQATAEDQTAYLVMQDMKTSTENYKLNINKKVKEKISAIKNTVRTIAQYKKTDITPVCSYIISNTESSSTAGQSVNSTVAKTWPQINYENAKEVKIESEKNQQIHNELLPILNQIFNSQVKMTDSMNNMWLTYIFPRLITRADVEAVQKKYEAMGYKIDESENGRLYVSKIGISLHMTFSVTDSMRGKLEVLF